MTAPDAPCKGCTGYWYKDGVLHCDDECPAPDATDKDRQLLPAIKIATLDGVREHTEHEPVELWLNSSGHVVVRAYNECRNNYTEVDLADLVIWMTSSAGERARITLAALSPPPLSPETP